MTSNLYDYRSSGVGQHYFPDETVDEPGPSHAPKTASVSLLYPYAVKYDDLFLPRPELSKFSGDPLELNACRVQIARPESTSLSTRSTLYGSG